MSELSAFEPESELLPETLPDEPFGLFQSWFDEAWAARRVPNAHAFALATADPDGSPSVRMVLCKDIRPDPGYVVFYTNYQGAKGRALSANPRAAACFHWDHFSRQARISGPVVKSPPAESDAYFKTRHWTSRIGAWASAQSEPIESHDELLAKVGAVIEKLDLDMMALMRLDEGGPGVEIPRPAHWGGYRLFAERMELWCGGEGRVHDRAVWTRELTPDGEGFTGGEWSCTRLQP